jgi:hypothetical protein
MPVCTLEDLPQVRIRNADAQGLPKHFHSTVVVLGAWEAMHPLKARRGQA